MDISSLAQLSMEPRTNKTKPTTMTPQKHRPT
jgi:hypothetical protein